MNLLHDEVLNVLDGMVTSDGYMDLYEKIEYVHEILIANLRMDY